MSQIHFKTVNKCGGGAAIAEIAARRMFPLVIVKVNIAAACSRGQKYPGFYKKAAPGGSRETMLHLEPHFGQKCIHIFII